VTLALALSLLAAPIHAEQVIELGDLLLVHGRVLRCPDRLRLVEVIRIESASHPMLALGEFGVLGREPRALLAEIRARLARELGGVPPVEVELLKDASIQYELVLLNIARTERACDGYKRRDLGDPARVAAR